jgi:hypothetical protein
MIPMPIAAFSLVQVGPDANPELALVLLEAETDLLLEGGRKDRYVNWRPALRIVKPDTL